MKLFGRKKNRMKPVPEESPVMNAPEEIQADAPENDKIEEPGEQEPVDYYDWKARYDPWPGVSMMTPVFVAAGVLVICVLALIAFVFHPIW